MSTQFVTVQSSGAEGFSNLKVWLRDLSPICPGVHRSVAKRQLILACREFFTESFAWQGDIGLINVVAGQNSYALSPFNAYTDVIGVMGVAANGVWLKKATQRPATWPGATTGNFPITWWMLRPDIVALYPTPVDPLPSPITLQIHVALKPKNSVEQVPLIAQTHFYEAILAGVLYRLLNQPAKPYSNPELARYYEQRFRAYIGEFAAQAKMGFNGGAGWCFPRFGK